MDDIIKDNSYDDISEMIENNPGITNSHSPEEMGQALSIFASLQDEEQENNPWTKRCHTLESYVLDVVRDGSDGYFKSLTEAIQAITSGSFGSIDYKGYKIYYSDTPTVRSISLDDGHAEYSHEVGFHCDALMAVFFEEYHSEDERQAFLAPNNDLFKKTLALLDREIEELDKGVWIKEKETLSIHDFKDYSAEDRRCKRIEWNDREKDASNTLSFLLDDAFIRAKGLEYSEEDFGIFSDVIRRMVFFADYGKRNHLFELDGFIRFEWKPKIKRDRYIWRCMHEFGQGDVPDSLLDNCTIYYFLDNPQGWEALAYLLPIAALWEMCQDYEPDNVKDKMLEVFDRIPGEGYRDRIEKLIEEDRIKTKKGECNNDQENL